MNLITCPDLFECTTNMRTHRVFVAGGISGCPDWQKEMVTMLNHADDDLVLFNPRRDQFDISDRGVSEFQIEWEFEHLHVADAILFWFPMDTLCPITLFELGAAATAGKTIFVGCDPQYARAFDVKKQLSLIRPAVEVRDSLSGVAKDVMQWYGARRYVSFNSHS